MSSIPKQDSLRREDSLEVGEIGRGIGFQQTINAPFFLFFLCCAYEVTLFLKDPAMFAQICLLSQPRSLKN